MHLPVSVFACVLALACAQAAAAPRYTATPLGALGGAYSRAHAINARGQITGEAQLADGTWHAFLWTEGVMRDLDTSGGTSSTGYAINAHGHVTGCANKDGSSYGFVHYGDVFQDLRMLAGDIHILCGRAIDDAGRVLGDRWHEFQYSVAPSFLYDAGTVRDAPQTAMALNGRGDMAGTAYFHVNAPQGWVSIAGVVTYLTTWGGPESYVNAINERGEATGALGCCAIVRSAGTTSSIGTLDGAPYSFGRAINDHGEVVGDSYGRAFLYTRGRMLDLNSLVVAGLDGEALTDARGINDSGSIVANSCRSGPPYPAPCKAYRLDLLADAGAPVPANAPWGLAALALLLAGTGMFVARMRRG